MIVYLHGFNSSPQSHKAQVLARFMQELGAASEFACPALAPDPQQAIRTIEALRPGPGTCLVGSSLGGFYATYLAEKHGARAVLLNPAIEPYVGLRAYLGPQKNLYSGEPYELTQTHLDSLARLQVARITPALYLLIVETGDELLDYRQAVRRYEGCEQVVVPGGDHTLPSFPQHLSRILRFAGLETEPLGANK